VAGKSLRAEKCIDIILELKNKVNDKIKRKNIE